MKKIFIVAALTLITGQLFAQVPARARQQAAAPLPPPLATREVSGIIKDETGQTVIGASIALKSKTDTIRTATNEDGIFILKDVKLATFTIEVKGIGYTTFIKRYLNSDVTKRIVLPPIVLKTSATQLNEVTINGTPSITYKTDTVEYKASDYKVRPNATVDETLKKMEGVEVGTDGSVTFQGQAVTKAKLNGKEFSGGNVAQAIQNLPADIMDKIQFVDDYGDQAARTGVKDGDPQKVLNLTTKADRSVGNIARITAQYGSHDRYNGNISLQRINANQTISIIGNFRNTVNGVASSGAGGGAGGGGGGGGSPGTTQAGSPTISYRDQWSKKLQVVGNAGYSYNNLNSETRTFGERYTSKGTSYYDQSGTSQNNTTGQNARFQMEMNLDSANFLQLNPSYSRSNSTSSRSTLNETTNDYTNAFEHYILKQSSTTTTNGDNYALTGLFVHVFKKPRRNVSIQASVSKQNNQTITDNNYNKRNFAQDPAHIPPYTDSLSHTINNVDGINTRYGGTITYVEPLGKLSQLEFRGDANMNQVDNTNRVDTVLANGQLKELTLLGYKYNYTTTDTRATLDYRYNGAKFNLSIGAAAVPYFLSGTKVDKNTGLPVQSSHSYFRVIPALRFSYSWSRTERITLTYQGTNNEPDFTQIQPFTDRTNPDNYTIGNPDLKPMFTNSVIAQYNNYIANSKLNFSFGVTASNYEDYISSNRVSVKLPPTSSGINKTRNETYYVNLDGRKSITGRYSISKQLDDRRYSLSLNGNMSYAYTPTMSDNKLFHGTTWRFNERFGPRINPSENVEVNPFVGYDLQRTFSTASGNGSSVQTTSLGLTGNTYFFKTWRISYSASKSIIKGIQSTNITPLVIDGGFEKEIGTKRSLVITFNAYDLLHQNNYIQQTADENGITNTVTSTLSRYFMFGIRLNLQKWSGRPQRNGINMQRRGDGSFIYN